MQAPLVLFQTALFPILKASPGSLTTKGHDLTRPAEFGIGSFSVSILNWLRVIPDTP